MSKRKTTAWVMVTKDGQYYIKGHCCGPYGFTGLTTCMQVAEWYPTKRQALEAKRARERESPGATIDDRHARLVVEVKRDD